MIQKYKSLVSMLVVGLLSNNAYATTSYLSEASLSLEIIGFTDQYGTTYDIDHQPGSILISAYDNFANDDYSTLITGDAYADGVTTPYSDSSLIELGTQASGYAGSAYSYAQSDATASGKFEIKNTSLLDYSINMMLKYSFSGEVETDTPNDEKNGRASVDIYLFGDNNFGQEIDTSLTTTLGNGPFSGSSHMTFSFLLDAGETENIFADIYSYGESESVSAVPLPSSILLMASALMGLIVRRKQIVA